MTCAIGRGHDITPSAQNRSGWKGVESHFVTPGFRNINQKGKVVRSQCYEKFKGLIVPLLSSGHSMPFSPSDHQGNHDIWRRRRTWVRTPPARGFFIQAKNLTFRLPDYPW